MYDNNHTTIRYNFVARIPNPSVYWHSFTQWRRKLSMYCTCIVYPHQIITVLVPSRKEKAMNGSELSDVLFSFRFPPFTLKGSCGYWKESNTIHWQPALSHYLSLPFTCSWVVCITVSCIDFWHTRSGRLSHSLVFGSLHPRELKYLESSTAISSAYRNHQTHANPIP